MANRSRTPRGVRAVQRRNQRVRFGRAVPGLGKDLEAAHYHVQPSPAGHAHAAPQALLAQATRRDVLLTAGAHLDHHSQLDENPHAAGTGVPTRLLEI